MCRLAFNTNPPPAADIILLDLKLPDQGGLSLVPLLRERQVLELMAMGYVKKEVAEELGISYGAVALYTSNIYEKLQVPNVAAAVAAAIRKGLI